MRGVGRPGKIACCDRARSKGTRVGGHGVREGEEARNRRERLVVGRSVEARSREPADEPSLESRVFHDERACHNDRGGKGSGDKGEKGRPRSTRGVEARYARCNSLAKSHFGKTFVRSGRLKNCASRRM